MQTRRRLARELPTTAVHHKASKASAAGRKAKEESKAADKIELKQQCEREIKVWIKLVKNRKFPTDLKMQNEAALIARGIVIKMQVLKTEHGDDSTLEEMAKAIVHAFGQVWTQQSLKLVVEGPNGGPVEMSHTVKGQMNLQALEDAIKRDQER